MLPKKRPPTHPGAMLLKEFLEPMALVEPDERTPAAAYTNTARYVTRPFGPPLAALAQTVALGLPFVIAGGIKSVYDVSLWCWFRRVPLPDLVEVPA